MAKLLSGTRIYGNLQIDTNVAILGSNVSTSTTTGAIVVTGGVGIGGNLNILNTGDVSANIGTLFLGNASTNANLGAFQTFSNSNAATQATSINSINANLGAYQTYANTKIGTNTNSNLVVIATTTSTSTTTGALVVAGGAGFGGNIYSGSGIYTTNGVYWAGNGVAFTSNPGGTNGQLQFNNSTTFGGANIQFTSANGNLIVTSVTSSTSANTGALVALGGAGFGGNVYSGNRLYTTNGVYWAGNNVPYGHNPNPFSSDSTLGTTSESVTSSFDLGLTTDLVLTESYDLGSLVSNSVVYGQSIVAGSIDGTKLITGTDLNVGLVTASNITAGNVLPLANITGNLGSPSLRWKDVYLSGSSVYLDNVILSANSVASTLQVNGIDIATADNYDLDDISGYTDGITQVFPLTYNLANVNFMNPWQITVAVNGILQPAFDSSPNTSIVWQSLVFPANKGYTLGSNSQIKFVEAPAPRSDIYIRKQPGTTPTTLKILPFKPIDVMMGY